EKKPATPSTSIRNSTSVGWLTAQADRLKRFIALSKDDPIAKNYKQPPLKNPSLRDAKRSRGLGRFWIVSVLLPEHLRSGGNSPRRRNFYSLSFRDGPKDQTRNL